jgi:O-antigen ligase
MNYIGDYSFSNPNSQFTRILFEGGIVGFIIYLLFLVKPALQFLKMLPRKAGYNSIFLFFLLTGSGLAHRSLIPFIFAGLVLAYNRVYRAKKNNSI